jgi:hypothetical protein
MNFMQSNWVEWLSSAEFIYINCPHSTMGQSPFFLEYGYHPNQPNMVNVSRIENPTAKSGSGCCREHSLAHCRHDEEDFR